MGKKHGVICLRTMLIPLQMMSNSLEKVLIHKCWQLLLKVSLISSSVVGCYSKAYMESNL